MKLRRGSIESPWGATLPVQIVPVTTDDDDFEEQAVEWLQLYYPDGAFHTLTGRAWPVPGPKKGSYLRPDIVTLIANTDEVVFVGDAKRHKRLVKRSVEKVVKYAMATKAEKAAVFVPVACNVGRTAEACAQKHGIEIVRL